MALLDFLPNRLEIGVICAGLICAGLTRAGKFWVRRICSRGGRAHKKSSTVGIHGEEGIVNQEKLSTVCLIVVCSKRCFASMPQLCVPCR